MSDLDLTQPGPAGLYRFVSDLTQAGWHQENKARARLERWCLSCGQPASFGFGVTLMDEGCWSCGDSECRAAAEKAADRQAAEALGRAA